MQLVSCFKLMAAVMKTKFSCCSCLGASVFFFLCISKNRFVSEWEESGPIHIYIYIYITSSWVWITGSTRKKSFFTWNFYTQGRISWFAIDKYQNVPLSPRINLKDCMNTRDLDNLIHIFQRTRKRRKKQLN